jgi:hypothetical protein
MDGKKFSTPQRQTPLRVREQDDCRSSPGRARLSYREKQKSSFNRFFYSALGDVINSGTNTAAAAAAEMKLNNIFYPFLFCMLLSRVYYNVYLHTHTDNAAGVG